MKRVASSVLVGLAVIAGAPSALAYCPCYTLSSSNNSHDCGVEAVNGTNPSTAEWQSIFDTVAKGPTVWGNQGPAVADIGQGCGKPEALHDVPAQFACELLKAIAMAESGWTQFCVPDTPADQVGGASRTIISFDCGYGVGQVTSGMHIGETPGFDKQRVAAEPLYNMATGASILASKWRATNCVGDNQPRIVEHWYTATWAYNGLAYVNNPNNPNYSSSRGVYNPAVGGSAPYQEKVFGRVEYPSGTPEKWQSVPLAYPNPADIGGASSPPDLPEPTCASPTDCGSTRSVHQSSCFGGTIEPDAGSGGSSGTGGEGGAGGSGTGGAPGTGGSASSSWTNGGSSGNGGTGQGQQSQVFSNDEGGCGCRTAPARSSSPWPLALLLFTLLARRRRSARNAEAIERHL